MVQEDKVGLHTQRPGQSLLFEEFPHYTNSHFWSVLSLVNQWYYVIKETTEAPWPPDTFVGIYQNYKK